MAAVGGGTVVVVVGVTVVVVVEGVIVVVVVGAGDWVAVVAGRLVPAPAMTPPPAAPEQATSITETTARYLTMACLSTVPRLRRNRA
jgi:hypothetical protein